MTTKLTLWNGQRMPLLGLGTSKQSLDYVKAAVNWALEAGYRLFDTAHHYRNEAVIGQVLEEWIQSNKIKREDVFVMSKLPCIEWSSPEKVENCLKSTLERLRLDYLDLYMIHVPFDKIGTDNHHPILDSNGKSILKQVDHIAVWKSLELQVGSKLTRAIGLCNFNSKQIERIMQNCTIKPAVLQIELHAYFQQRPLRTYCQDNGIAVCAYASLGSNRMLEFFKYEPSLKPKLGMPKVLEDPVVKEIASVHGKTPAQILLRHAVQQGIVAIPKSGSHQRIQENIQIFDFHLSSDEMKQMDMLNKNFRSFDFTVFFGEEIMEHPEYPFHDTEDAAYNLAINK